MGNSGSAVCCGGGTNNVKNRDAFSSKKIDKKGRKSETRKSEFFIER